MVLSRRWHLAQRDIQYETS